MTPYRTPKLKNGNTKFGMLVGVHQIFSEKLVLS